MNLKIVKQESKTHLYRIYGDQMKLLYVGITSDMDRRMRQHSEKHWWAEMRRIDSIKFDTTRAARDAETEAINSELPLYNKKNGRQPLGESKKITIPTNVAFIRKLVTLEVAADYLAVSQITIRRMISEGRINGYRLGNKLVRVDLNEIDAALQPIPNARSFR